MSPQRIQLRRQKGWRKPPGAVVVSRPSKWGNPFKVVRADCAAGGMCWTVTDGRYRTKKCLDNEQRAREVAVDWFQLHTGPLGLYEYSDEELALLRKELRGKDLCCWCPLKDADGNRVPCHADVLLALANPGWKP